MNKQMSIIQVRAIGLIAFVLLVFHPGVSISSEKLQTAEAKRQEEKSQPVRQLIDPAQCKRGDKRYIYWAAGDQVFRFRYDPKIPLYLFPEREKWPAWQATNKEIPPARDPKELEGCYDNPLRSGNVPYMKEFSEIHFKKVFGRKLDSGTAGMTRYYAEERKRQAYLRNLSDKKLLESGHDCWVRNSGVKECLISKGNDRADYSISRAMKIDKSMLPKHREIDDLYLTMYQDAAAGRHGNGYVIENEYSLFDYVRLTSSFRLFPEEIDLLVPFYRGMVDYIIDAHLSQYKWSDAGKRKYQEEKK